jgi:hypothetical protein
MDVSKQIVSLWQKCFADSPKTIRDFYNSFDCEGNIIIAHEKNGEIKISRGFSEAKKIVGIVNRVPVKLHLGNTVTDGAYLYGCCVDEEYRNRGIFTDMINNAASDCDFLCLIPQCVTLFEVYRKLGFVDCLPSPFPFECDMTAFDGLDMEICSDASVLAKFDGKKSCDGFTAPKSFVNFVTKNLPENSVFSVYDDGKKEVGYVIAEKVGDDRVKILDTYIPSYENDAIRALKELLKSSAHEKSLIRFENGRKIAVPALNRFGEY